MYSLLIHIYQRMQQYKTLVMTYIKLIESESISKLETAVNRFIFDGGVTMQTENVTVGTYVTNENLRHVATVLYKIVN